MSSQRKDLPVSKRAYDESLDFTAEDLQNEWLALYETPPPPIGAGEMYMAKLAEVWHMERHAVATRIKRLEAKGEIVKVGERLTDDGHRVMCWRVCKTLGEN